MTRAHSAFEPSGNSSGHSSYSPAMPSGIRKHFLLLGLALALAAPPPVVYAQKGDDKVPPDKFEQKLSLQKIFHNPFPSNEWVKRLVTCGDTLYMAVGNRDAAKPAALRIYRLEHAGCKLWVDVTPAWKATPTAHQVGMAAFNGKLFVGTDKGEIHRFDPQGASQFVKQVNQGLSSMVVFKGQLYAVGDTSLYRTSDGSQWDDLGPVLSLPDAYIDGATTLEEYNGYLYLGLGFKVVPPGKSIPVEEGIQIWRAADGKNFQLFKKVSGDLNAIVPEDAPQHVYAMKSFAGYLYIGGYEGGRGYVTCTDGNPANWKVITFAPAGAVVALGVHDGKLYAGLFEYRPNMAGYPILASSANGTQWATVTAVPIAAGTSQGVSALGSHGGRLYFGTADSAPQVGGEVFELGTTLSVCQIADIDKFSNKSITSSLLFLKNNLKDAKLTTAGKTSGMLDQLSDSLQLLQVPEDQKPQRDKALDLLQTAKKELQSAQALIDLTAKSSVPEREKLLLKGGAHVERAETVFQQYLAALAQVSQAQPKIEQQPDGQQPAASGKGPGIHGRVFALDESGDLKGIVPGALIEFKNAGGATVAKVTTNEQGYYKLDLATGNYIYKVTAAGYKDEDFGRGRQIVLTRGYAIYNFSLVKGKTDPKTKPPEIIPVDLGKLQGQVFEKTADGKLVGIPGAVITLVNPKSLERPTTVVTQNGDDKERGKYEVVLEAATYRASVLAVGFDRLDDPQPIVVEKGKTATRDFILSRIRPPTVPETQGIKGTITLIMPKEEPAKKPPIQITIVPVRPQAAVGPEKFVSDGKGKYLKKRPVGLYEVIAEAEGFVPARSGPRQVYAGRFTIVDLKLRPLPPTVTPEPKDITVVAKVFQKEPDGSQGPAISGASVLFRPEGKPPIDKGRAATNGTGEATLTLPAGKYDAVAFKEGFKPQAKKADVQANTPQIYVFLLEPEKAPPPVVTKAKITFKVLQPEVEFGSTPLPGADVEVTEQNRAVAGGKTSSAGIFVTGLLPPGTYDVIVAREGFVPARLQVILADKDVHRDVLLKPAPTKPPTDGRLHLWVVEAPAERGKGIGQAQVHVTQKGKSIATAETEPDGRYTFGLKYGAYTIDVVRAGYKPRSVEVAVNQPEMRYTIALVPDLVPPPPMKLTMVRVRVLDAATGQTLPAAEVGVLLKQKTLATQTTGADGETMFRLKPGVYTLAARKSLFNPAQAQVTVAAQDQYVTIRLVRSMIEPIVPPVVLAHLHLRAVDRQGRPVSGAQAVVQRGGTTIDSAYTGSDGQTTFRLKPGPYAVVVSKPGYKPASFQFSMGQRDVRRDIVLDATDVVPPKGKDAHLQITVNEREPRTGYSIAVGNATVTVLFQGQTVQSGVTDGQGRYHVQLERRVYEVVVAKTGYVTAKMPADLRAGDTSRTVTLVRVSKEPTPPVEKKAWLQLQVLEHLVRFKKNVPLADADVQIRWGGQTVGQGKTDSAGRFSRELRRDLYQVVVSKPGYESAQLTMDLRQGNVQRDVVLSSKSVGVTPVIPKIDKIVTPTAKKVSLTVRIMEMVKGQPKAVAGAMVVLQQGGKTVFQGQSNEAGTFYAGNLNSGNYRIIVSKMGFHTVQIDTAIMDDAVRPPIILQRSMVIK